MPTGLDPPSPPSLSRRGRVPPNSPPRSPPRSQPPSTSEALLVVPTPSLAFVKPAGLDLIQRMLKRARAAQARQARHNNAAFSSHTNLTRYPSRVGTRKTASELHILLLCRPEGSEREGEEAVQGLLRAFAATSAQVYLHQVEQPAAKLSLASFTKGKVQLPGTTRGRLEGALAEGTALAEQLGLDGGVLWAQGEEAAGQQLTEVGFAFPHDTDADTTESSVGFMEVIATRMGGTTPVTLYIAPRPTSADFDLDEEDNRSVRIAHAAADTLTKALAQKATATDSAEDEDGVLVGNSKRMSLDWNAINVAASQAANRMSTASTSSGHSRRHSFIPSSGGSYLEASPAVKPLLLRPAPGPGPQSVSLRLALPGLNQDVVLRVAEAVSPVDEVRTFRHRPSSSIGSRPQDAQSDAGGEEAEAKRDSFLLPILSRGLGASRSPSPSAASFASNSSRRSSRVSFTSSISEENEEDGPFTPPSAANQRLSSPPELHLDTAAHGGSLLSPIDLPGTSPEEDNNDTPTFDADKYATLRKRRSEVVYGGRQETGGVFVEGDMSPVWGEVASLLKGRAAAGGRARGVGGLPIRLSQ